MYIPGMAPFEQQNYQARSKSIKLYVKRGALLLAAGGEGRGAVVQKDRGKDGESAGHL